MSILRSIRLRLRALLHRRQLERDLEDELAYHLEMRRANAPARAPFGNATSVREQCRETWSFESMENAWRELRHAWRFLSRSPGHTATVIALLALGLGANTAMFSLVNALFIRELPVHEPDRLVVLNPGFSTPLYQEFRKMQGSFDGLLATGSLLGTVATNEAGEQIVNTRGGIASGNYFQVLGLQPAVGRFFTEEDDTEYNARTVMVLSHEFWQRQFNSDADVLGKRILLFGTPFTILGVTPPEFTGEFNGRVRDFWVPLNTQPLADPQDDYRRNWGWNWLSVMGRLKPGITMQQAQAEAHVVFERLMGPRPAARESRRSVELEPGSRGFGGLRRRFGTQLQILAGTVAIVLLIVCANVATLLLARGAVRQREIAVRQALGCSRGRLLRQLFLEGLLLAIAAGAIGLLVAPIAARALLQLQPSFFPIVLDVSLDRNMLFFGAGISLLTAIAFSLAPAVRASRVAIEPALKSASRGSTASRQRAIRGIVALQTALSVMLVAAAFLFAQSLARLKQVDAGFDREHIISSTVNPRLAGYREDVETGRLGQRLVERLSAIPGVKSASVALCAVMMGCSRAAPVTMEGHEARPEDPPIWISPVSPNYFETAGMPLVRGRGFGVQDRPGSTPVAVVTEALARFYFPDQNPIGKHFSERTGSAQSVEIVGVVRDVKFVNPRDAAIRMAFLSIEQFPGRFSYVQVKTAGPPEPLVPAVRRAMLEVEPRLYIMGTDPLSYLLDLSLTREVMLGRFSAIFGVIALLLACFGVYGVISYLVASRTTELGIRLAIGAQPGDVLRHVIAEALWTVVPGIAIGIAGAWAAGRLIQSLLFGVTSHDPLTFVAVTAALVLTTTLAALFPALRASRINPLSALRCE